MDPIMRRFVHAMKTHLSQEDLVAFESCLECRHCGTACAWYLSTADECLHPKYKTDLMHRIYRRFMTLEGRLLAWLGLMKTPTVKELRDAMDYYWRCTACGRCSLACPLHLSNRSIIKLARTAYLAAGLSLENPVRKSIAANTRELRHSFGLTRERLFLRMAYFLSQMHIELPFEVVGADYLFICPSVGNTKIPDYGIQIPQMLNAAGVRYTISARLTDTGTEIDHIVVDRELSRRILMEIEDEAERLGAKTLLISECGCDIHTFTQEAARVLGRAFKPAVKSLDRLLLEHIESQRLPVIPVDVPVTLHDPCYVTRLSGMGDLIRALLRKVSSRFTEMNPNRELNYCCNGGSGPFRHPENNALRHRASQFKVNQIKASQAEWVITPCAVCMLTLEDVCREYRLGAPEQRMVYMLFEIVYLAVARSLQSQGQLRRFRMPVMLAGKSESYIHQHTVWKIVTDLPAQSGFTELANWFTADAVVQRFFYNHPGVERPDVWIRQLSAASSEATLGASGRAS